MRHRRHLRPLALIIAVLAGVIAIKAADHVMWGIPAKNDLPFMVYLNRVTVRVDTEVGRGSAVHLQKNVMMSARHVCELFAESPRNTVKEWDGYETEITEWELAKDPEADVCIFKVAGEVRLPEAHLADPHESIILKGVIIPSYAGGVEYSVRAGTVITSEFAYMSMMSRFKINITTAYAAPGASGSGDFNEKGEIIGITSLQINGMYSGIVRLECLYKLLQESKLGHEIGY